MEHSWRQKDTILLGSSMQTYQKLNTNKNVTECHDIQIKEGRISSTPQIGEKSFITL